MSVSISSNVHWGEVEDCDLHVCKITLDPGIRIDVSANPRYFVGSVMYETAMNLLVEVITDNGGYEDVKEAAEKCRDWLDNGKFRALSDEFYDYYEGLRSGDSND